MLEYQMMILEKVSFSAALFEKELRKTILMLQNDELQRFRSWVFERFAQQYGDILRRCLTTSRIAS